MSASLREVANNANQNYLGQSLKGLRHGDLLQGGRMFVTGDVGTVTTHVMTLPTAAKAVRVLAAYATTGSVTGALTPVLSAPATTEVGITATGDISFQATDAVTVAEVSYISAEGSIFTETVDVASSLASFQSGRSGVLLLTAEVVTGVIPGDKTVDFRGLTPAAGEVVITDLGQLSFNAADVVAGTAIVSYYAAPGVGSGVPDPGVDRLNDIQNALV